LLTHLDLKVSTLSIPISKKVKPGQDVQSFGPPTIHFLQDLSQDEHKLLIASGLFIKN
jgi:hypothetical protein